jgi:hypothetical protein
MIRIDEIYQNVFFPYFVQRQDHIQLATHDPFGATDADSICVYIHGEQDPKLKSVGPAGVPYLYMFDQEPVQMDVHAPAFSRIKQYGDLKKFAMITSEKNSEAVEQAKEKFGGEQFYYFFHGWAALDWYRGYDKTFLTQDPEYRKITKTFMSPNRIIGGRRLHRLYMLYWMQKHDIIKNNWVSCPTVCPVEKWSLEHIAVQNKVHLKLPDIVDTVKKIPTPLLFPGEDKSVMSSFKLTNMDIAAECLLYHVNETVGAGQRLHLTEKTFKPICMKMPFILTATQGSLEYLRSYGFKTFDTVWDESYDTIGDDKKRYRIIGELLRDLDLLSVDEKQELFEKCIPIIEHNYDHFYEGGFEEILWDELHDMLGSVDDYFSS